MVRNDEARRALEALSGRQRTRGRVILVMGEWEVFLDRRNGYYTLGAGSADSTMTALGDRVRIYEAVRDSVRYLRIEVGYRGSGEDGIRAHGTVSIPDGRIVEIREAVD